MNNNEALFQLPHVPVGDTMPFNHHTKYYSVLQVGMDVAFPLLEVCGVLLGTPGGLLDLFSPNRRTESSNSNISRSSLTPTTSCLQEVHGKDEFLRAIQVLAPRFRLFGTFLLDNENAGGSAICIHRDLLPEDAIVSHVITCQGP